MRHDGPKAACAGTEVMVGMVKINLAVMEATVDAVLKQV